MLLFVIYVLYKDAAKALINKTTESQKESAATTEIGQNNLLLEPTQGKKEVETTQTATLGESHSDSKIHEFTSSADWLLELTNICSTYFGEDYFVADIIPQNKLKNAMKNTSFPMDGKVISLIDSTLFGSVEKVMVIGQHSLCWYNEQDQKTISKSWSEFSNVEVKLSEFAIEMGVGNTFNMTGSRFDKDQMAELLKAIQFAYIQRESNKPVSQVESVLRTDFCADMEILPGFYGS